MIISASDQISRRDFFFLSLNFLSCSISSILAGISLSKISHPLCTYICNFVISIPPRVQLGDVDLR